MNPCQPSRYAWNTTDITHECQNGEMTLRVIRDLGTWDPLLHSGYPGVKHFSLDVVYDVGYPDLPLLEGQTLELRLDCVRANRDGVYAYIAYVDRQIGENLVAWYTLMRDRNEVFLAKSAGAPWSETKNQFTVMSWDYGAETDEPVTMVLAMTRLGDTVEITARILLRADPTQILFERTVRDGPGVDFPEDGPVGPQGMLSVPDVGPPFGEMGYNQEIGMYVLNEGGEPLSEVVIDNLEYRYLPVLDVEKAVCLSRPLTEGEFVIEAAPTIDGPWEEVSSGATSVDGDRQQVWVLAADQARFFRLREVETP
ncbi:MAG: hypothetical protein H7A47_08720 [Verrucomicrobiales bacterium]|nr:hypothetical protein [Verrucomicrobiales bacterium]